MIMQESGQKPTAQQITEMPYVKLLAYIKESNRPPGGYDSIRRLIQGCHLGPHLSVLHAGCNAGFLSREIARLSGCRVVGIDLSSEMVQAATSRAAEEGLTERVHFEKQDMRCMNFEDESYDVTLSGGALAFVENQEAAIEEWVRVTRSHGLIADVELFYRNSPPVELRKKVAEIIDVDVPEYREEHWHHIFNHELLVQYDLHHSDMIIPSADEVEKYCCAMVENRTSDWNKEAKVALLDRLKKIVGVFNENLSYMSYMVMVFRRLPLNYEPFLYV
jgi:ubiquinone/menaquinone biosynthesis C-methylase UbiE